MLLRGPLGVSEFVNADDIARGLSAFRPESVAMQAGRMMLARLDELTSARADFAFETTLASRTFAPRIKSLAAMGYEFHLIFLYLPDTNQAVQRVARRVVEGGHNVPVATILRRHDRGIRNFFEIYQELTTGWYLYDNSVVGSPRLIAVGAGYNLLHAANTALWDEIRERYGNDRP